MAAAHLLAEIARYVQEHGTLMEPPPGAIGGGVTVAQVLLEEELEQS
jgi:hypothetical protein